MKIVVLPGLDGSGTLSADLEKLLAEQHSVVCLQLPSNLYQYADLQGWVAERLPTEDYILVAESFSGPLAVMIASEQPTGLKGLVLVATFAKAPRRLPMFLIKVLGIIPIHSRPLTWLVQPLLMGKWTNKKFTTEFRHALGFVPTSTIAKRLREILKVNVTEKLSCLGLPSVYLLAKNDWLVPSKMSEHFIGPSNTIVLVEGPHFLLQANPTISARHIINFANQIS